MNRETIANTLAGVSGTSFIGGLTLAEINAVLQAGAFIVAMVSGLAAAYYYLFLAPRRPKQ